MLRPAVQLLANITVLTALLVYFGWRRSATQAERLGIAESVLQMSTRDYLLRSVRPVLVLLIGVGVAGLAWVALDRYLVPAAAGSRTRRFTWTVRALSVMWLVLPAAVWVLGFVWRSGAFVLFPASIGAGVLLLLYAAHLRQLGASRDEAAGRRHVALQACAALLAVVALFWTAANYAQVEGVRLAASISNDIASLPGVRIYSEERMHLDGPGVAERRLSDVDGEVRYRYEGLRLLEHTGGRYFLISDGWTRRYGVLFVVPDDGSLRLELVRDRR